MGPGSTRSPSQSVHPQGLQEATGPTLAPEARYGLAGDVVRALEPHTEADPAGLLCNFLAGFGNLVGPGPHYLLGAEPHPPRLNVLVVGATARSRKGTSWSAIAQVLEQADPGWAERRIKSGLASGEALVQAVRDETRNRAGELVDAGEPDKRLLVLEPEFVRVLAVAGRDGSTLSSHLREAWDKHGRLENLTKSDQVVVRRSHISILGFVDDLPATMAALDVALYSPLESDGMSRVLFEYLASGVPVVASRVGVVVEVLEDGRTALLVPAGEPEPLATAITRLLEDRALRLRLGTAGSELARASLSGARLAERLSALYLSLAVASAQASP